MTTAHTIGPHRLYLGDAYALLPYLAGSFHRFAVLTWIKPNPSPMANKHYLADIEPFIHAWNRGWHPRAITTTSTAGSPVVR